ncbi:flagellar biosynthesis protein FlhF [Novispirillum itersonii]|uniref:Flagellar biosynthesis GTPase FlhF n=1 Tax=Novispirillum itersonii TaxID=189 RepID=A0A7W9ZE80_NOVIT|nr:GTPase [Novispirillum itersonii]MBB6208664.1 flagellar biosynthesis GTPase FlhF [Novispirillum itersonii]
MRLKSYSAVTMSEAMAMVRAELGDDAIIVSTQRASGGQGVRITAALEEHTSDQEIAEVLHGSPLSPVNETIRDCLVYHGVPPRLCERMLAAARSIDTTDATMATAGAMDELFTFAPLPSRKSPMPVMLVGPPGSGKTITVAKLAARARLAGRSVTVITADSVRAGAMEQLSAFTSILGVELKKARGASSLEAMAAEAATTSDLVYIDTPGLNPFSSEDIGYLNTLTHAVSVEAVLVLAAGGDPMEATEVAEIFAQAGATRLLATRLDMTRRLGAVLAAADAGQFMFSDVSINPHVANGLCSITPVTMARLLVPPTEESVAAAPDDWSARRSAAAPIPSSAQQAQAYATETGYGETGYAEDEYAGEGYTGDGYAAEGYDTAYGGPPLPPADRTYADPDLHDDPQPYAGDYYAAPAAAGYSPSDYDSAGYGQQPYGQNGYDPAGYTNSPAAGRGQPASGRGAYPQPTAAADSYAAPRQRSAAFAPAQAPQPAPQADPPRMPRLRSTAEPLAPAPAAGPQRPRAAAPLPRLRQPQPISSGYGGAGEDMSNMPDPEPEKSPDFFSFLDTDKDTNEARG